MAVLTFTKAEWRARTSIVTPRIEATFVPYPTATGIRYSWGAQSYNAFSNHGDFVSGQVRSFGRVLRSLSGRDGSLQSSNFGFAINDQQPFTGGVGTLAALMSDLNFQYWYNRVARVLISTVGARAASFEERVIARGYITSYRSPDGLSFDFSCDDFLTSEFSPFNPATTLPKRRISTAQFTDCPPETLGLPEPIIYGDINDVPDGTTSGAIPLIYVGTETITSVLWHRFMLCGHAIKELIELYAGGVAVPSGNYGVDVLAPGKTGWPFGQTYRDVAGRRYTLVYARGPIGDNAINGTATFTCNAKGAEVTGDGTGALIDTVALQYRHFMIQYVFLNYLSGNYLSNPVWNPGDPTVSKVNATSFATVDAQHLARIGGFGARGAGVLGLRGTVTVGQAIKEWNISADCQSGIDSAGQYFIVTDDVVAPVIDLDETDLIDRPVPLTPTSDLLLNEVPYLWKETHTEYQTSRSSMRRTQASIDAHQATRTDNEVRFKWIRDDAVALSMANYRAARYKDLHRLSRLTIGLYGLELEMGQWVRVTYEPYGWILRSFRIEQIEIDLNELTVDLVVRDMTATPVSATTTTALYDSRTGQSVGFTVDPSVQATVIALSVPTFGGGSLQTMQNPAAGTYETVIDAIPISIDWDVFAQFNAYWTVWTRTQSGNTVTPRVYNVTDAGPAATGASSSATGVDGAEQQIVVTRPPAGGVKRYVLQITRGTTNNARVAGMATVRMAP